MPKASSSMSPSKAKAKTKQSANTAVAVVERDETGYHNFLANLVARFGTAAAAAKGKLFTTNVNGGSLYDLYLSKIPEEHRGHHTCNACKHFIRHYGNVVAIDDEGRHHSVFWESDDAIDVPEIQSALTALRKAVGRAQVDGVFVSDQPRYGYPKTGTWQHPAVTPLPSMIWKDPVVSDCQRAAAYREDFKTLNAALADDAFRPVHLRAAQLLFRSGALKYAERFAPQIEWLIDQQGTRKAANSRNKLWLAVAFAPAGFCSPRSNVIGDLLTNIRSGDSTATLTRKFNEKVDPGSYQRPQAPPKEAAINRAEEIFAKKGLERSLHRRYARLGEIPLIWVPPSPKAEAPGEGGVFARLRGRDTEPPALTLPTQTMTWEKFQREVLPTAQKIEFHVPYKAQFAAMVTAVFPDAPPVIQWDVFALADNDLDGGVGDGTTDIRNPVNWYVIRDGSFAARWGLSASTYAQVVGIANQPNMWRETERFKHHGDALFLLLEGAKDTEPAGLALFPEVLRGDLHEVRSVIEAYSNQCLIEPTDGQLASGYRARKGERWDIKLRVTDASRQVLAYHLDRWD